MVLSFGLSAQAADKVRIALGGCGLGERTGKASITYTLEKLGIENVSDETVADILKEVKQRGTEKRALLTIEEFKEIVDRQINGSLNPNL